MREDSIYRGTFKGEPGARFYSNPRISKQNREAVREFIRYCASEGLSEVRIIKYFTLFSKLQKLSDYRFNFLKATEDDIRDLVVNINRSDSAEATKKDLKVAVKKFYKTMNGGKAPEKVSWIKCTIKKNKRKLPDQLISVSEVEKLINACKNDRDRAIIATLYYAGLRVGELGSLRIKDAVFEESGVRINVPEGKTGARSILVIEVEPYLMSWINVHPSQEDLDAPLWVDLQNGKCLRYDAIRMMLRKKSKVAGVRASKVNPHNFRHSRATYLANYLTESQMCAFFGWTQGSEMPSTYVHLSGRDLDSTLMEMHNLQPIKKHDNREPRQCSRCSKTNPPDALFCMRCRTALTPEAMGAIEKEEYKTKEFIKTLFRNNQFTEWFKAKFAEPELRIPAISDNRI